LNKIIERAKVDNGPVAILLAFRNRKVATDEEGRVLAVKLVTSDNRLLPDEFIEFRLKDVRVSENGGPSPEGL
jgi:hypothetical protein